MWLFHVWNKYYILSFFYILCWAESHIGLEYISVNGVQQRIQKKQKQKLYKNRECLK